MAYEIQMDVPVRTQVRELPVDALKELAEAMVVLQVAPWSGNSLRRDKPGAPVRTLAFGAAGMITYLILEDQQIADVLSVFWAGPA
jgi:hypothetical protein